MAYLFSVSIRRSGLTRTGGFISHMAGKLQLAGNWELRAVGWEFSSYSTTES